LLGLACRTKLAPRFAEEYLGDVLWGALFFLVFASCWPSARRFRVGLAAVTVTELIELSQLYRAAWAEELRGTRLGGLLLGHVFSWSDVLCVALGAGLLAFLDARKPLRSSLG
jgi:hypothetical protein